MPLLRTRLLSTVRSALSHDGVDDYTIIPIEVYGWSEITVSTWFFPVWPKANTAWSKTLHFGDDHVDYPSFYVSTDNRTDYTRLIFGMRTRRVDGTLVWYETAVSASPYVNSWNHYALRLTRDRVVSHWFNCSKIFERAVPSTEYTVLEWNPDTATYPARYRRIVLGSTQTLSEWLSVLHAVVTVHSVALSDSDIQRMCVDVDYVPLSSLVRWYHYDSIDIGTSRWLDKSIFKSHATIYGATRVDVLRSPVRALSPTRTLSPAR